MKNYFLKKIVAAFLLFGSLLLLFFGQFGQVFKDIRWNMKEEAGKINSMSSLDYFLEQLNREIKIHLQYPEISDAIYARLYQISGKEEYNRFAMIKTKDDSLLQAAFYSENDTNLYQYAKRFSRLSEQVKKQGGTVFYVNIPDKSSIVNNVSEGLPYLDYGSAQDEFLNALLSNGVQAIDLRIAFSNPEVNKSELYYRTDKCLTNYGAFYVFKAIVDELEEKNGIILDPDGVMTDLEQYKTETYQNVMYGKLAKTIGMKQLPYESYTLYYPEDDGIYQWKATYADGRTITKRGRLYETLFLMQYLDTTKEIDSSYVVLGKNNSVDRLTNENNPEAPRILLIRDDNIAAVATFLLPYCSQIDMVMADTDVVSIESMIEKGDYDIVIMGMTSERLRNSYFPFFKKED